MAIITPEGTKQTLVGRLNHLFSQSVWGLGDQALVSLTSFLMMVLLARALTPDDFGAFVLIYGALLLANALQSGLFTQPHNVLGSSLSADAYVRYTSTTMVSQSAFTAALVGVVLTGSLVAYILGWAAAVLLLALAPAVIGWQIQEFFRRVFYTENRVREAFLNDCISYGGQILGIVLVWQLGALSGQIALCILAATSALAAIIAAIQLRSRLRLTFDRAVARDNWNFGKWLFGANLVQSGRIQLHLIMIGSLISVTSAGLYRAVQNLVAPTHIMMNAIRSIAMPQAAAIYAREGLPAMRRYYLRVGILGLIPIVLYLVAVSVGASWILHLLYDGQYDGYAWLVWIFSIVYALAYFGQLLTIVLSAMRITRAVMIAELATLAAAVLAGIPLIWTLGIGGALLTDVIVGITLAGALSHQLIYRERAGAAPRPPVRVKPAEVQAHGN